MLTNFLGSSFLILAVFLIRLLFRKKTSRRFIYALWLIVLVRLLVPVPLFDLGIEPTLPISHDVGTTKDRDFYYPPITGENPDLTETPTTTENPISTEPGSPQPVEKNIDWAKAFQTVHIIGASALALWFGYVNISLYSRIKKDRVKLEASCSLPVYKTGVLTTPCLFGVIKPSIYLTDAACDEGHMNNVITHEMCHYRHWDNLWNFLGMVCVCLWWWNPLVWLSFFTAKRDGELACDELALEIVGENGSRNYGVTLIEMAKNRPHHRLCITATVSGGAKEMKERITAIANKRKNVIWVCLLIVCLMAGCTVIGFSGKNTPPELLSEASDSSAAYDSFKIHLDKFYKSDERRTVFDKQGNDITSEFFAQTQKMYENDDWDSIIDYFKNNVGRAKLLIDNRGDVMPESGPIDGHYLADWLIEQYHMTEIELPDEQGSVDVFYAVKTGFRVGEDGGIGYGGYKEDEYAFNSSKLEVTDSGKSFGINYESKYDWKAMGYFDVGYRASENEEPLHLKQIKYNIGMTSAEIADTFEGNPQDLSAYTPALIRSFDGVTMVVDPVEYITTDDADRIAELELDVNFDLSNGYYVHNETVENIPWRVGYRAVFEFVDWNRQFTSSDSPSLFYVTESADEFLEYCSSYDGGMPTKTPFFFTRDKNGNVTKLQELLLT